MPKKRRFLCSSRSLSNAELGTVSLKGEALQRREHWALLAIGRVGGCSQDCQGDGVERHQRMFWL